MATKAPVLIPVDMIAKRITLIRNQRVIIDSDLAALYGVSTGAFNQAVKRNQARFPNDFMFQLSKEELEFWRSQIVISNASAKMGLRRTPYAFTEHGAYMAGNVLKSKRAIEVSVFVVRAFVQLRDLLATHKTLRRTREAHYRSRQRHRSDHRYDSSIA
jgi:ORF6N domain